MFLQSENPQIACQSADLHVAYAIHAICGSGIAHEFRLHARAASSSDVFALSTSAEEQHHKLFEEFCSRKYATARNKTISQLKTGSEFTERCDAGCGGQVKHTVYLVCFVEKTFENFTFLWKFASFLRVYLFSSN